MRIRQPYCLPADKEAKLHQAQRLEWITIAFMLSIILVMYLAKGSSQAMQTAWAEDILTLVPPIAFLTAMHFRSKPPNQQFPYGYRRAISIAFLCTALALSAFGVLLLGEAGMMLLRQEHVTIQTVELFGRQVWSGWLMLPVLTYSAIPPFVLGRMKLPLARELHEKVLRADAEMNKADWLTALAGIAGIIAISLGWEWADTVAAGIISFGIIKEGFANLKDSVLDLVDEFPTTMDGSKPDPTAEKLQYELEQLDWVAAVTVGLREEGDVLTGEVYVVPQDENNLLDKLQEAQDLITSFNWRLYDVVVTPVRTLR